MSEDSSYPAVGVCQNPKGGWGRVCSWRPLRTRSCLSIFIPPINHKTNLSVFHGKESTCHLLFPSMYFRLCRRHRTCTTRVKSMLTREMQLNAGSVILHSRLRHFCELSGFIVCPLGGCLAALRETCLCAYDSLWPRLYNYAPKHVSL